MLSMKFPNLFLRPEIIITFLWGWEWGGGQVRHRSPRNSGIFLDEEALLKIGAIHKGKNLLLVGANSFIYELTPI